MLYISEDVKMLPNEQHIVHDILINEAVFLANFLQFWALIQLKPPLKSAGESSASLYTAVTENEDTYQADEH